MSDFDDYRDFATLRLSGSATRLCDFLGTWKSPRRRSSGASSFRFDFQQDDEGFRTESGQFRGFLCVPCPRSSGRLLWARLDLIRGALISSAGFGASRGEIGAQNAPEHAQTVKYWQGYRFKTSHLERLRA